ncbi:MAG: glucosamine-6-phosphate deaminase-like protein [Ramlibacter sp.]|nr:glucosamine-6-phosphate deaminase-like protein [Ramlibacter sp.]
MTNVVVVAPHPDDESIGCGGTILLHTGRGDRVHIVFLSSGELGVKSMPPGDAGRAREREAQSAARSLDASGVDFLRYPDGKLSSHIEGAGAALARIVGRETPELIYLPHEHDAHPDHQSGLPIVRSALRACAGLKPTLLTYEIWTPLATHYHVEDVTRVMGRKIEAIRCHRSQVSQFAYDRAIRGLNLYRGVTAGACRYAEIFQTADPHCAEHPQAR